MANPIIIPSDANLQTSDITTNNVSTSKHGFCPKGTNTGTKFLRDDGSWETPAGGGLPAFTISLRGNCYVSTTAVAFLDFVDTKTITRVDIQVGTAPTDATLIVDIHKNGTTIFTTQSNRPMITSGNTTGYTTTIEVSGLVNGDRLEFFVDQVGSTVAGANLGIRVSYS